MTQQKKSRLPVKVLRFMSAEEVKALVRGKKLNNPTDHKAAGNKTDSVGFCFMPVNDIENDGVYYAARRLCGITTTQFCLVGELKHHRWRKGYGVYGDYNNLDESGYAPPMQHDEYSTKSYSKRDFDHFKVYKPNELEEMNLAEIPPLIRSLVQNSSVCWQEPSVIYCTHLDMDCVRSEIRKAEPETVVTPA